MVCRNLSVQLLGQRVNKVAVWESEYRKLYQEPFLQCSCNSHNCSRNNPEYIGGCRVCHIPSFVFIVSCSLNVCGFVYVQRSKFKEIVNTLSMRIQRITGKILEPNLKY